MNRRALLRDFVGQAFPEGKVTIYPDHDKIRVHFWVDPVELAADHRAAMREVLGKGRPKFKPRRRLHWGKKH